MARVDHSRRPEVLRAGAATEAANRSQAGRREALFGRDTKRWAVATLALYASAFLFPPLALPATILAFGTVALTLGHGSVDFGRMINSIFTGNPRRRTS